MAGINRSSVAAILVLRLIAFASLLASVIVLATNSAEVLGTDEILTFKDAYVYRYVFAVGVIGAAYMLVQLPLSLISLIEPTKSVNSLYIWLRIVFDLVFALFVATGAGAGFGFTVDYKNDAEESDLLSIFVPGLDKFFNLVYVSCCLLLLPTMAMAAIILCSTLALARM